MSLAASVVADGVAAVALLAAAASASAGGAVASRAEVLAETLPAGFVGEIAASIPNTVPGSFVVGPLQGRPTAAGQHVWRWASVTKQLVAVLVMQEVEAGRIDLDAPVRRYLPGASIPGGDTVTVRRLLNHTSGLFNPEDGPKDAAGIPTRYLRSSPKPARGLDPQCLQASAQRAVGQFNYNNCDYVVAGALLEAVTGESFAQLVAARIAGPLGLKSLRVLKPGQRDDIIALDRTGASDFAIDAGRFGPAANLAGTVADLLAIDRALLDGRLLRPETRAELWKGDPKLGHVALGQWSYSVPLKGCAAPVAIVERRGEVGNVQVRNFLAPVSGSAIAVFAASSVPVFGEPWQGKGISYDLLSAALCPEPVT